MTQIFVGFLWFVAFGLWTLGVYLLGKYLGQGEAYRAGMSAGFSEGYDRCLDDTVDSVPTFEQIAGLWSDEPAHRDCIRPEADK